MTQQSSPEKDISDEKSLPAQADALRYLECLLNVSGFTLITTTLEGLITGFNKAAETLLGYSAADVIGKATPVIFHDPDEVVKRASEVARKPQTPADPAFDSIIQNAQEQNPSRRTEWTFVRRDGKRFTGSLTVVALRDALDRLHGFAITITDLTEQKRLIEQAETSEQRFQLLADSIPGAIYLCKNDKAYSTIFINDRIQSITGYTKDQFLSGKINIADLFHPDDKRMIYETINRCVAERKSFNLRYRIRHASGEWRWVDETGVGVYESEGLTMLEGFLQDVTMQQEAEEKLQKVAEENLRFFNNPVNLNAVADFSANLIRISPSWTAMFGWTEDELRSQNLLTFIHPDDIDSTRRELDYVTETRRVHTFENRLKGKDGSHKWLLWALSSDPETKLIYASAVDISARKKSEENILDSKSNLEGVTLQLQEQNRKLDEFAHIISHNLRAPVKNIQALINLLDNQSEISDYKLIFDKLKNVAKNLGETMNELMDTLKVKTQSHVDLSEIRFKEVLDKVVQSLEGELIVAQASVTFDFNEAPTINYSKPYLESIFQNLLTNAVKYRSPNRKPSVHFRSYMTDNHLELQVTDNGQGIDLEKFGDKLFGLHKTFHTHQEARGVGLFLVKTQVEALGGSISVNSEVDKGTTFTIRFN
jgi:PAS domain S-box-containing protein